MWQPFLAAIDTRESIRKTWHFISEPFIFSQKNSYFAIYFFAFHTVRYFSVHNLKYVHVINCIERHIFAFILREEWYCSSMNDSYYGITLRKQRSHNSSHYDTIAKTVPFFFPFISLPLFLSQFHARKYRETPTKDISPPLKKGERPLLSRRGRRERERERKRRLLTRLSQRAT